MKRKGGNQSLGVLRKISTIIVIGLIVFGLWTIRDCMKSTTELVHGPEIKKAIDNVVASVTVVDRIKSVGKRLIGKKELKGDNTSISKDDVFTRAQEEQEKIKIGFRFDPAIDFAIYTYLYPFGSSWAHTPKVGIGFIPFVYGSYYHHDWRFIRIGIGGMVKSGLDVTLSPFMYNLGKCSKWLRNSYVHPFIGYNVTKQTPAVGVMFSLSF